MLEADGATGLGRPRLTLSQVMVRDIRESGLKRDDAHDHGKWRKLLWGTTSNTCVRTKNGHKMFVVVCLYIYIYIYIYTHTHTHTHPYPLTERSPVARY